jgi:tetratricopeptide (TPR) repeat protein
VRRVLYWKRLLIVAAVFLLLTSGVFAVHHFQRKSQTSALKTRAEKLAVEAETDPTKREEAIARLREYVRARPDDEVTYQKYATLLLAEAKTNPAAFEVLAKGVDGFLNAFPNHPEERQKLIELYIATAQPTKLLLARLHLEMLLKPSNGSSSANIDLLELAATCEQGLGNLAGAIEHLEAAIATDRAPVRTYQRAMELHNANKSDPKRNTHIDEHLRALRSGRFATSLEARIAAARFEMVLNNLGPARADMKEAFDKLGGNENADALLAMAELELLGFKTIEQGKEQYAKAEALLRKAFALDKKNVPVGLKFAEVLYLQGKREEGVKVLKQTAEGLDAVNDQYLMLVDRLIDLGEQNLSLSLVEKLALDPNMRTVVTYYRGRLAALKEDWQTARKLLDECAPNLTRAVEYHKKAMVGLAACYSAMQNPDKQLEYCRAALRDDSRYPLAIIGEAEALVKMGEIGEALKRYRLIVNALQIGAYRSELVRLELLDVLVVPVAVRNWARFDESLGAPEVQTPEIKMFHADSLVARGRPAEAIKLLEDWLAVSAHAAHPRAAAVWVALSRIKGGGGNSEATAAILDEAQKKVGDVVEIRLARVGLLAARAKPPASEEFDALVAGREKFPKPDQFRLLFVTGQTAGRVADRGGAAAALLRETAFKHLRAAADLVPNDLACRAALLDQGVAAGRADVIERALKEMATIEGENGPVGALGRIAVRLPEVRKISNPNARAANVRELRALAERVQQQRPGWSRAYVALAQLDELEGLNDKALENYTRAIKLNERQEYVVRRAVELYRVKRQDEQALGLLDKLSTEMRLPDDLERYRSIHKLLTDQLPQDANATIDRIAPYTSSDYRILLLRGSLLGVIHDNAGALQAFMRAVAVPGGEKNPGEGPIPAGEDVPETWASLVAQLVKAGKIDDAKRAVGEAKEKLTRRAQEKTTEAKAELQVALGGLYELIGDTRTALDYYETACQTARLELNPIRQLILFFQRTGQPDKALALLNRATGSPAPDVARWARRHLALTLIGRPDAYNQRNAAMALIEKNLAAAATDPEDVKARAMIQTVDPVTREEGVRTLRQYSDRGDLTPDEYHLLGRLAFDEGKYLEAERHFKLGARVRPGVTAEHLAAVVRVYLAIGRIDLADLALERLKGSHPGSWEAVREEVRVLHRKSKDKIALGEPEEAQKFIAKAKTVIMGYPGWNSVANIAAKSGRLFDEVGLTAEAREAYEKYLADSGAKDAHVPLALFYVYHKQPEKAIALALEHEGKLPVAATAELLSGAVRMKRPVAEDEAKVEKWLDDKLRAAAGNPEAEAPLIGVRAQLLDARGNYKDAIAEYERSIATFKKIPNPKTTNDGTVNNLCMLLALYAPERADEAVKMMTELIGIRGPRPGYLDTRAVAYLVSSRPEEAIRDLQMALVQYERAAYRFHYAWALDLDPSKTRPSSPIKELETAKRLGLSAADLHPIEFERYTDLLKKHGLRIDEK